MNTIHPLFQSAAVIAISAFTLTPSATAQVVPPVSHPIVNLPTDFYPPSSGAFATLPNAPATNYGSVLIRNWRHTGSQKAGPLAGISAAQVAQVKHTSSFEISTDNGQSWKAHSAPATGELKLSPVVDGGQDIFNNELWSLSISGGTLPSGMMIRESPSKASTGKTTRAVQADGSCNMSSYFDIFTEVSLDGGQSWLMPVGGGSQLVELVLEMEESFFHSNFLPLTAELRSGPLAKATFAGGPVGTPQVVVEKITRSAVSSSNRMPPPAPGQPRVFNATQPVTFMLSVNGGQSFTSISTTVTTSHRVTNNGVITDGVPTFDTEMLLLNIQGGNLPPGMLFRESPTRASTGKTTIRTVPGGFRIGSFFDVFTEFSMDGGQTWRPALESTRLSEIANSRPVIVGAPPGASSDDLRILSSLSTDPGGLPARTAGGAITIESIEMSCEPFRAMHPPSSTESSVAHIEYGFLIRHRQEFGPQQMTRARGLPPSGFVPRPMSVAGVQTFDTEMLSLTLTNVPGSPGGILFRESPTRASTGLLTLTSPPGGPFKTDSYFDVFIEVSLDGGQSWLPTDRPMRLTAQPPVTKVTVTSPTLPPALTQPMESYFYGLVYTEGNIVNDLSACAQSSFGALPGPGQQKTFTFDGSAMLTAPPFGYKSCATRQEMSAFFLRHTGDSGPTRYFDTEMLSLNISGGGLPAGYMIRESPTLASVGKTTATLLPNGNWHIGTFFDVFTELSLDGGVTWKPCDGSVRLNLTQPRQGIITAPGGGAAPSVRMFSGGGMPLLDFSPGQESYQGGVRVAAGDVNGDGAIDIITGSGPGGSPGQVRVQENANGVLIGLTSRDSARSFQPFSSSYTGGIRVAAGDVNGDGRADIIVGADQGAQVKVVDMTKLAELRSFLPYSGFSGGVTVAAGDVNGDGRADIITGAGSGATGGHVKVFDGKSGAEIRSFLAFPGFSGGVNVAAGDVNGDGFIDIVVAAGAGGGPHVKVFDGNTGAELQSFFAYSAGFAGGVNVATGDLDGDGRAEVITGAAAGAPGGHVKVFSGADGSLMNSFFAYEPAFSGGVFVAGVPPSSLHTVPTDDDCDGLADDWEITHWRSTTEHDGMDDSDGDGVPAVAELAFGMDPNKPDVAALPEVRAENSYLVMTITKRPGVIYEVQSGSSLDSPGLGTGETTVLVNDLTTLKVRDNVAIRAGNRRFMRAAVTGAP